MYAELAKGRNTDFSNNGRTDDKRPNSYGKFTQFDRGMSGSNGVIARSSQPYSSTYCLALHPHDHEFWGFSNGIDHGCKTREKRASRFPVLNGYQLIK